MFHLFLLFPVNPLTTLLPSFPVLLSGTSLLTSLLNLSLPIASNNPPSRCNNQNCLQTLQNHPWLRTTDRDEPLWFLCGDSVILSVVTILELWIPQIRFLMSWFSPGLAGMRWVHQMSPHGNSCRTNWEESNFRFYLHTYCEKKNSQVYSRKIHLVYILF